MNNGKICVSVCAKTADELIEKIKRAEEFADVIEIRFDCLDESEFDSALRKVDELKCEKPFIATFRPKDKAVMILGRRIFKDEEERKLSDKAIDKRFENWEKIFDLGNVKYLDFEQDILMFLVFPNGDDNFSLSMFSKEKEKKALERTIIFSEHFFNLSEINLCNYADIDEFLVENYEFMLKTEYEEILPENEKRNDIIKIAVQADDITDTIPIWKLLKRAKSENQEIIPIAMGEAGKWTRILGLAHGAFLTFASLDSETATAPGQVSAQDLHEVYRVKELDESTDVYGILGSNTSVSMSPYIHNFAFKYHNLNAVFVPLQVHDLDAFITKMVKPETREIDLNFKGFSVTIPHKQSVIKHLDFIDETAEKIGAVNTVKIIGGKLHGFNTDARGFIEPLKQIYDDLKYAKVLILGAGGASKACQYALQKEGADVTIFGRSDISNFKFQNPNLGEFDIIVNATPIGMRGKAEGETPIAAEQMKGVKLVYDLVYIPQETELIKQAKSVGIKTLGGLEMLLAQAVEQQRIWTNSNAPIDEIRQIIEQRLLV
jgi:3-dehydroquinate dehydratase / shikimate dehydrogenase